MESEETQVAKKQPTAWSRVRQGLRWTLLIVLALFAGVVAYRVPVMMQKQKTAEAVAAIQNQKLDWATAAGKNLPDAPDEALSNTTLVGTDANQNGIRDDVERAIFARHPNSAAIRAPELQYALELGLELSQVSNAETLAAAIEAEGRGYQCVGANASAKTIENLVFNTPARKAAREAVYQKYMTSFVLPPVASCDIAPSALPN